MSSIELNSQNVTFATGIDNRLENNTELEQQNDHFRDALKTWAVQHNITHQALRGLLKLLKLEYKDVHLPLDPRTLLETPQATGKLCIDMAGGKYWHHGLKACLDQWFANVDESISISLNINVDGLPIYKSSKYQLWPILCNVHEMPQLKPLPVGIFLGKSKPSSVNEFLTPFVDELLPILEKGCIINYRTINIRVRCLICDSPARAFVKGVVNFNGKNGCLKCTIHGEYSYVSRTVVFPSLRCPLRIDEKFRQKKYGQHHTNQISPLLRIPKLDMIQDFVVADSLHLLDLGLMKRLLIGWRDGNFGFMGKLSALQIQQLSNVIVKVKLPKEFHRKTRSMDCTSDKETTAWSK
ncbi:uncharacterized protein LOC135713549 [Ochlerotatus camptorhynchus]|uniref:uncharacterized protein LOC135713549 n=1 Tax=Ochlerotatus camptorhynchus TaxID=644619 RepID=UPI0031D092A8